MANKLSNTERLARELEIAKLARMGLTMKQIGHQLGLTESSISKILSGLREEWKQQINRDIGELQARQAAEIVDLKVKSMKGWDKSLEARTKKHSKTKGKKIPLTDKNGKATGENMAVPSDTEQSLTIEETNGDPRFLIVYTKLMEREANLLGIDAPKRIVDETGKVGLKIDLSKLSDEQLEAIASAIDGVDRN